MDPDLPPPYLSPFYSEHPIWDLLFFLNPLFSLSLLSDSSGVWTSFPSPVRPLQVLYLSPVSSLPDHLRLRPFHQVPVYSVRVPPLPLKGLTPSPSVSSIPEIRPLSGGPVTRVFSSDVQRSWCSDLVSRSGPCLPDRTHGTEASWGAPGRPRYPPPSPGPPPSAEGRCPFTNLILRTDCPTGKSAPPIS